MKTIMIVVTLILVGVTVAIAMGAREGEGKIQKQCRTMFASSGERAGCVLGAYSEQHKLDRTCNILTSCAMSQSAPNCLKKRLGAVIRELSERSHSRSFVSFSRQAISHMDAIIKMHPIHIVNACRSGRNMVREAGKAREQVTNYETISSPVSIGQ
ncbi:hypothetical protein KKF84_05845 [Myxococcota bacterium]|nr:hypothetical protein [Myxococcota bacterium]MBU1534821.1 hypothetical protein [Myxococcota bacterium]